MLFNSFQFLLFFPIVTLLFFCLPHRWRWLMLLVASCIFYMAFIPVYLLILIITILIDYFAGIWIERTRGPARKIYLVISIISTCAVLFVFKYLNFFNNNMITLSHWMHWDYPYMESFKIILPIGLSFHTFQSLSYVVEVYRGHQKAEHHFGIYSLYVMFYPQLVAGPIERPQNLLHQFYEKHYFEYQRVTDGLKRMAWGMFKKVVIADRLAIFVNEIYGKPDHYHGLVLALATFFFAYQIYCDFSGYSDIALGAAQVMGFKMMENFRRPYYAKSIADFWKRWHISLSTWFRDYVYISLGGNRCSIPRWYFNLFITFVISGFWHGANWTYVIWGALNGFYLIFSIGTQSWRDKFNHAVGLTSIPRFHKMLKIVITFSLIYFSWIFFRASSMDTAFMIIHKIARGFGEGSQALLHGNKAFFNQLFDKEVLPYQNIDYMIAFISILILELVQWNQRSGSLRKKLSLQPAWVRWAAVYVLVMGILLLGTYSTGPQLFIYFQF